MFRAVPPDGRTRASRLLTVLVLAPPAPITGTDHVTIADNLTALLRTFTNGTSPTDPAELPRHATAVDLARFDAQSAFAQSERAAKNNATQIAGQAGVITAAAFVIGLFVANHAVHRDGLIGIGVFAVTFTAAAVLGLVTGTPWLPRRAKPEHSGWLGPLHLDRDDVDGIRAFYLQRAADPLHAYGQIVIDVGAGAHRKHRHTRWVAWLTIAAQIELIIVILLLACGI